MKDVAAPAALQHHSTSHSQGSRGYMLGESDSRRGPFNPAQAPFRARLLRVAGDRAAARHDLLSTVRRRRHPHLISPMPSSHGERRRLLVVGHLDPASDGTDRGVVLHEPRRPDEDKREKTDPDRELETGRARLVWMHRQAQTAANRRDGHLPRQRPARTTHECRGTRREKAMSARSDDRADVR